MAKTENGKKENSETAKQPNTEEKPAEEEKPEKQEIEKLKFNVEKLSEELNTAVAELKRSIIDIRSAVSEIENPFNLLRVITSEKDLEKIKNQRLPPGVKSIVIGKPEEKPEEKKKEEIPEPTPAPPIEHIPETEVLEEGFKAELEEHLPKTGRLPRGTAYLDWVWSLLNDGFTSEDIRLLSRSYENLGFLPEGCSDQVYSLAVVAEKAKAKGLTKSRLLLNMYKASVISGIGIGLDDLKRLITIAERKGVRGKMAKRVE